MNALLPTSPDRAIEAINAAFRKLAQEQAEIESAYVASAIALTKNFDLLRGTSGDGEQFLGLVKLLKTTVAKLALSEGDGPLEPELKMCLISTATDHLMSAGRAQIEGKELDPALRDTITKDAFVHLFAPRPEVDAAA